jgi:hypothetical protein
MTAGPSSPCTSILRHLVRVSAAGISAVTHKPSCQLCRRQSAAHLLRQHTDCAAGRQLVRLRDGRDAAGWAVAGPLGADAGLHHRAPPHQAAGLQHHPPAHEPQGKLPNPWCLLHLAHSDAFAVELSTARDRMISSNDRWYASPHVLVFNCCVHLQSLYTGLPIDRTSNCPYGGSNPTPQQLLASVTRPGVQSASSQHERLSLFCETAS